MTDRQSHSLECEVSVIGHDLHVDRRFLFAEDDQIVERWLAGARDQ